MQTNFENFKKLILTRLEQRNIQSSSKELFLRRTFKHFDIYETGKINRENFHHALQKLGVYINRQTDAFIDDSLFKGKKEINYVEFINKLLQDKEQPLDNSSIYTSKDYQRSLSKLEIRLNKTSLLNVLTQFVQKDSKQNNMVDFNGLLAVFAKFGFSDLSSDFKIAFNILDKDQNGFVNYVDFIGMIQEELSDGRVMLLNELFEKLAVAGKVSVYGITGRWNLNAHPNVKNGSRTFNQVEEEYRNGLDSFCKCRKLNNSLDSSMFKEFFLFVSSPIKNDNYFKLLLERLFVVKLDYRDVGDMSVHTFMTESNVSSKLDAISKKYRGTKSLSADRTLKELLDILMKNGLKSLLSFVTGVYAMDKLKKNQLTYEQFQKAFSNHKINLSEKDIIELFRFFQKNNFNEFMTITSFHDALIGVMSSSRQRSVGELYDNLVINYKGNLNLKDLNSLYKGYNSQDSKIKSFVQKNDFVEAVGIYCAMMNHRGETLPRPLFVDFFRYVSLFFSEDYMFQQFLDNSWQKHIDSKGEFDRYKNNNFAESQVSKSTPYGVYSNNSGVYSGSQKTLDKSELSSYYKDKGISAGKGRVPEKKEEFSRRNMKSSDLRDVIQLIRKQGGLKFLLLKEKIEKHDRKKFGEISIPIFSSFVEKTYRQVLRENDIERLAAYLSKGRKIILYAQFYDLIKKNLETEILDIISRILSELDLFKTNLIVFEVIKNKFRSVSHPHVIDGLKMKYDIHREFTDILELFCELDKIKTRRGTYEFNYDDLCNLFSFYLMDIERSDECCEILARCFGV